LQLPFVWIICYIFNLTSWLPPFLYNTLGLLQMKPQF
jgi:hypothetical protein